MAIETMEPTVEETAEPTIHDRVENDLREFFDGFQCQKCGKCCQEGVGIALWPYEVSRLKRLGLTMKGTVMLNGWTLLKMPCVFYQKGRNPFGEKKCKIYNQRPIVCKLYPTAVKLDGSIKISEACPAVKK